MGVPPTMMVSNKNTLSHPVNLGQNVNYRGYHLRSREYNQLKYTAYMAKSVEHDITKKDTASQITERGALPL